MSEEAGRVTLYAPGEAISPEPRDPIPEVTATWSNTKAGQARAVMRCWFVELTFQDFNEASLMAAIEKGDPRELYRIDDEMVPFWCPKCPASYRGRHWETSYVFDESFLDETRGRCLKGHERRLVN